MSGVSSPYFLRYIEPCPYRDRRLRGCLSTGATFIEQGLSTLTCISHHLTVEAHDTTAKTSLCLLAVLNVLFKYACARQEARASS